jgi:hypothetical protein
MQAQAPQQPGIGVELQAHVPLFERHIFSQLQRLAVLGEQIALARQAAAADGQQA